MLWIPGHREFRGLEVADDLARLEAEQAIMDPLLAIRLSYSQVKEFFDRGKKMSEHNRG